MLPAKLPRNGNRIVPILFELFNLFTNVVEGQCVPRAIQNEVCDERLNRRIAAPCLSHKALEHGEKRFFAFWNIPIIERLCKWRLPFGVS